MGLAVDRKDPNDAPVIDRQDPPETKAASTGARSSGRARAPADAYRSKDAEPEKTLKQFEERTDGLRQATPFGFVRPSAPAGRAASYQAAEIDDRIVISRLAAPAQAREIGGPSEVMNDARNEIGLPTPNISRDNGSPQNLTGPGGVAPANAADSKLTTYVGGIDRRQFYAELQKNPGLMTKMAWMVRGEVGNGAPLSSKIAMLETAFNRAQVRGHSLDQALLSVGESKRGYYARQTYAGSPPSASEVEAFKKSVLAPVLAGSNVTAMAGKGPMTGNASADVAANQRARGTPGYGIRASGGQTEYLFNEEHKDLQNGRWLPKLNEQTALAAAKQAESAIPGGTYPVGPIDAMTGGLSAADARGTYGTNEVGRKGNARGRRTYNPVPLETQQTRSSAGSSPLMQMLAGMGLTQAQIEQLLRAMGGEAGFLKWLNGRQPTDALMQQYLTENPAALEALLGNPGWRPSGPRIH